MAMSFDGYWLAIANSITSHLLKRDFCIVQCASDFKPGTIKNTLADLNARSGMKSEENDKDTMRTCKIHIGRTGTATPRNQNQVHFVMN